MTAMLAVKDLQKSFGNKKVLQDVSFEVERGHIAALVGPNGAGKSTIMKSILGLIPTDGGSLSVDGQPVRINSHQALEEVGALIEYPGIYPFLTGRQHLELFADGKDKNADIDSVVHAMEMERYINVKAKSYSLGMKQKLGIAQALLNKPELVILDEPMNGLDPQAVKHLRDVIKEMAANGTTFLISSHILSELEKLADTVLILNKGVIVEQTSMQQLKDGTQTVFAIATDDDARAKKLLLEADIELVAGDGIGILQDERGGLDSALRLLIGADIHVLAVDHVEGDLETSFLNVVNAKEVR